MEIASCCGNGLMIQTYAPLHSKAMQSAGRIMIAGLRQSLLTKIASSSLQRTTVSHWDKSASITLDYEAEIDVSIARKYRGKDYASSLIATASERIFVDTDVRQLHAWIKAGNSASESAFERARFKRCEAAYVKGAPTVHYTRIRAQDQPQ